MRSRLRRFTILLLLLTAALLATAAPGLAAGTPARVSGDGQRLLDARGRPRFVIALNYEGPGDRAWEMWDDVKFDARLIEADFQRAADGGAHALRLFVQAPLQRDISRGVWAKLDTVVELAERRGLQLIVSLHDYSEYDLAKATATAGQIAARYRGRPGILSYDLKNEPRFGDLALTKYASPAPLQGESLIAHYGERLAREEVSGYRASEQGREVPASLSDQQAWVYVNNLRLYRELLAESGEWVRTNGGTTLDYVASAAGQKWGAFLGAFDDTLRAWIEPQLAAIRAGDATRPVTIGHVDALLARLSANDLLDYQTLHRYPVASGSGVRSALGLAAALQRAGPSKPFVLGEFGFANEQLPAERTALLESALYLGLVAQGAAGGAKWMLNDMPEGYNMRQRTLGAFRLDGSPKPVVAALTTLRAYLDSTGSAPGELHIDDDADVGLRYAYRSSDALLLGGKAVVGRGAELAADGAAQLFLTWNQPGELLVWASGPLRLELTPDALAGSLAQGASLRAEGDPALSVPFGRGAATGSVSAALPRGGTYRVALAAQPRSEADYEIPNGRFFTQTNGAREDGSRSGFRVTNEGGVPFWDEFQSLGGVDVLGYPVTRRFDLDGFPVQAFQKGVLQWRADQGGQMWFLNTFDVLHDAGKDDWLELARQTPRPFDTAPDSGLPWEGVMVRHLGFLDRVPAPLKEFFLANPSWLQHYGLPVAVAEYPNSVVVRAQRATFQYWKSAQPWAAQGQVTVANGGDLAKEAGLWPWLASTPENAPR